MAENETKTEMERIRSLERPSARREHAGAQAVWETEGRCRPGPCALMERPSSGKVGEYLLSEALWGLFS